jgi:hypothetical protein
MLRRRKTMKLIPEARRAWRMLSVQAAALIVAWVNAPEAAQAAVLGLLGVSSNAVTGLLALGVIAGRLIDQPKVRQ